MRQVPEVAIIGSGRVARHFCHYFDLINLPYLLWSRAADPLANNLANITSTVKCILLLISDDAIDTFIQIHQAKLVEKILIHCSGQLITPLAYGAHPLMTFSETLYDLPTYQKIPFILDENTPALSKLLPQLNNTFYRIENKYKAFYHSLCVMSGNFTCLLWQKFIAALQNPLNLPEEIIYPYLTQVFLNLKNNPQAALTGPLVRNDKTTIEANLKALANDPFQSIYQAFLALYGANQND